MNKNTSAYYQEIDGKMPYYVKVGNMRSECVFDTKADAYAWADKMGLVGENTCEVVEEGYMPI